MFAALLRVSTRYFADVNEMAVNPIKTFKSWLLGWFQLLNNFKQRKITTFDNF